MRFDAFGSLPHILVVGNNSSSQADVEACMCHVSLGVHQFVVEARPGGVRVRQAGRYCGYQVGVDELAHEYDHREYYHLTSTNHVKERKPMNLYSALYNYCKKC